MTEKADTPAAGSAFDLSFVAVPAEDRLQLQVKTAQPQVWWLTRRMAFLWVAGWLERLQAVPLPALPLGMAAGQRSLADEHGLATEPDPALPTVGRVQPNAQALQGAAPMLIDKLQLTVTATGTQLTLQGGGQRCTLTLTRRDSHRLLEALVQRCRAMGWLECPDWPLWLDKK